jgi:hypothetical protein
MYRSATVRIEPGHLVHVELGVRRDGYSSDLQRMWYVRRLGELIDYVAPFGIRDNTD